VSRACPDGRCATCGDIAERATILGLTGADAEVAFEDGERGTVAVDLTPGVGPGDVVLVHQGVAIGVARDGMTGGAATDVTAAATATTNGKADA
jgi:hydrogenase expression/formation protein HypC